MKKLLTFFVVIFFIILSSNISIYAQGTMILVDSKSSEWIDTNIPINTGDTLFINASGFVVFVNNGQNIKIYQYIEPSGIGYFNSLGNLVDNNSPMLSLIGKIGETGDPFYVGNRTGLIYPISESGNLYLMVNDCINCFFDNLGYFNAVVFKGDRFTVSVGSSNNYIPQDFNVSQNYPNPFNPSTNIQYSVPNASNVKVIIYDINGQKIREIINDFQDAGTYTMSWDAKDSFGNKIASGTYFYQVQVGNFVQTKKMILLK